MWYFILKKNEATNEKRKRLLNKETIIPSRLFSSVNGLKNAEMFSDDKK